MSESRPPVILAIDVPDIGLANQWIDATKEYISVIKLGLEFFIACGSEGVRQIQDNTDLDIFLDLKLHDIPNTVGKAAQSAAILQPRFLTVHASGGRAMVADAVASAPQIDITAVTILTSLTDADLLEIGFSHSPLDSAVALAIVAKGAGARAIVCSPHETAAIRKAVGEELIIITPGVRPATSEGDDQKRTMTPRSAIDAGANFVVIGRPITSQWIHGADAMRRVAGEIAGGLV